MALTNGGSGVFVNGAPSNVITRNKLAANQVGIRIAGTGATGTTIARNTIGFRGEIVPGNDGDGIVVEDAPSTTVDANSIEGNGGHGIRISGSGATGTVVASNDVDGNGGSGVLIEAGAAANTVGDGNVIFENLDHGVHVRTRTPTTRSGATTSVPASAGRVPAGTGPMAS